MMETMLNHAIISQHNSHLKTKHSLTTMLNSCERGQQRLKFKSLAFPSRAPSVEFKRNLKLTSPHKHSRARRKGRRVCAHCAEGATCACHTTLRFCYASTVEHRYIELEGDHRLVRYAKNSMQENRGPESLPAADHHPQ